MLKKPSPVDLAIDAFGGVRSLARAVERDPAAVSRWQKKGLIPSGLHYRILALAREHDLAFQVEDLVDWRQK